MGVLDRLPADLRSKADEILADADSDAAAVIRALVDLHDDEAKLGDHKPDAGKPRKFNDQWSISQLIPSRRAVKFGVMPKGFATLGGKDGEVVLEGDWATYNVFLQLPLPKRPKPHFNLVLTKLGGHGPYLVLSAADPPAELVKTLKKKCKYADSSVSLDQVVPAYIGAQEGSLYLLKDFIFFGFKKPLRLFMLAEVESVSFTVVTSRTFNVVVKLLDESVHEFEKIPHEFHQRIIDYNAKHNLNDESLAKERQAKRQKTGPSDLEEALEAETQQPSEEEDEEDDEDDEEDDDFESGEESEQ